MKKTKRRDIAKRLKALKIPCQMCGQAPAVRYSKIGMVICAKSHAAEKRQRKVLG